MHVMHVQLCTSADVLIWVSFDPGQHLHAGVQKPHDCSNLAGIQAGSHAPSLHAVIPVNHVSGVFRFCFGFPEGRNISSFLEAEIIFSF